MLHEWKVKSIVLAGDATHHVGVAGADGGCDAGSGGYRGGGRQQREEAEEDERRRGAACEDGRACGKGLVVSRGHRAVGKNIP